jgi:hypothetical protein
MLKSKKHVFWEALVITIVVFLGGLFFGMLMEETNSNKVSQLYMQSEISLADAMSTSNLVENYKFDCDVIKTENINFADRIYEEAILLEKYEDSRQLTENLKFLYRKYNLLRTLIWSSNQDSLNRCDNYNLLVYLYESESEDTEKQATQNVWSKVLLDVKTLNGENVLLLPIAVDQNLTSLDLLVSEYEIERFPALIINNDDILYELDNPDYIEQFLD